MAAGFEEVRFNGKRFIRGTKGGATWSTAITQTNGGREQRNSTWMFPLGMWTFEDRLVLGDESDYVVEFFNAMGGEETGFRFKDWLDYKDKGKGFVNMSGIGDATAVGQLFKRYTVGSKTRQRKISKPVPDTVQTFVDGAPYPATIDYTTGAVAWDPTMKTITAVSLVGTTNVNFTVAAHGLAVGDTLGLVLTGGTWATITGGIIGVVDANTISLPIDGTGLGAFVAGHTKWFPQARCELKWIGEFDLPARFDGANFEGTMSSAIIESHDEEGYVEEIEQMAVLLSGLKIRELKM